MNDSTIVILKKMCEFVGCDFESIDFKSDQWYLLHEWTEEQQDLFITWLSEYMRNSSKARKELMSLPSSSKKDTRRFAEYFVGMYGWKNVTPIKKEIV